MKSNRFVQMQQYLNSEESRFQVKPRSRANSQPQARQGIREKEQVAGYPRPLQAAPVVMRTSEQGLEVIKQFEGFRANLYNDQAGHCTIGYGHLVHRDRCDGTEPEEFRRGITEARATQLLRERLQQFEAAIHQQVQVALSQHQFDALASFVFNIGAGAFSRSTLLRELNAGHYDRVPGEMNRWVYIRVNNQPRVSQGLVNRRRMESALFERGEYPATSRGQSLPFSGAFYEALAVVAREISRIKPGSYALSNLSYNVPGPFDIIRQPSGMTCWATVATMMECWRQRLCKTIEQTMLEIGQRWADKFRANQGLTAGEKGQFLTDAGMTYQYPQSLTAEGWEQLMRDYGPIWVTTDEDPTGGFAIHARLLVGIRGDGTETGTQMTIIDPASGTQYEESFGTFLTKYESEARTPGRPVRIQIVHYGL